MACVGSTPAILVSPQGLLLYSTVSWSCLLQSGTACILSRRLQNSGDASECVGHPFLRWKVCTLGVFRTGCCCVAARSLFGKDQSIALPGAGVPTGFYLV